MGGPGIYPPQGQVAVLQRTFGLLLHLSESESHSVVSNSLRPHGPHSPRNSTGQDTRVGCHVLLQGIFLTQGSNPGLPRCRWILHQLSHVSHAYYLVEDTGGGRGGCRPEDLGGPAPRICGASKSPSPGRRRPLGGQLYWTGPALGRGWDSGDSPQAGSGGGAWRGTSLGRGTCLTAATAARDHVRMASVWTSVVMEAVTPDP